MTASPSPSVRLSASALAIAVAAAVASAVGRNPGPPSSTATPREDRLVADTSGRFPHEEHAGLFPLCAGCHAGIGAGDSAAFYPEPASCGNCHDGEQAERVEWSGPRPEPTSLLFDHREHAAAVRREGEEPGSCESCHTPSGAPRMTVAGRAVAERCLGCHEHRAGEHYADARCATCHRPLAETGFGRDRIAALPEPSGHDADGFLVDAHGSAAEAETASCRTCHTRERCTGCHVDGDGREAVASVPAAPASMELPTMPARYPTPRTHESAGWLEAHGDRASVEECAVCHTRQSCTTCHRDATAGAVAALPDRRRSSAPGVDPARRAPASHRTPDFAVEHGDLAAADPGSCTSCHSESSCTDCHAGGITRGQGRPGRDAPGGGFRAAPAGGDRGPAPSGGAVPGTGGGATTPEVARVDTVEADTLGSDSTRADWPGPAVRSAPGGFHPENFMARHAAAAYGNRMECSTCHSTAAFCRDCHRQVGMGSAGRVGPGFHDAQPLWLLRHGQAARQALESCASCHRQTDCVQCHSTTGAFSVNPHGPNFDAGRFADRNRQVCLACHLSDPLGGEGEG